MKIIYPDPPHYRKPLPEERVDELLAVEWFSAVTSPDSVADAALAPEWADFRLERRNDLTAFVAVSLQQRGSEWNKCARAFDQFFDAHVAPLVVTRFKAMRLPEALLSVVRWDIVNYMQELNYSDVRRPDFFQLLWHIYREGHFPCGWKGVYPAGNIRFE